MRKKIMINGELRQMTAEEEAMFAPDEGASASAPPLEPWRFFAMLELSGKKAGLDAFIAAMPEPDRTVARSKLERSLIFYRDNDLVKAAQGALSLTDDELDTLWLQASTLP